MEEAKKVTSKEKQQARENVANHLERELQHVRNQIAVNKYGMKSMAEKQAVLKRQRGVLSALIKDFKKV